MNVYLQAVFAFNPPDLSAETLAVSEQPIPAEPVNSLAAVDSNYIVMCHFMNEHVPKSLICPVNVTSQPDAVLTFAVLSRREHITAKATQFNNGELALGQH